MATTSHVLSPVEVELLMELHYRAASTDNVTIAFPARKAAWERLVRLELAYPRAPKRADPGLLTPKGIAHVDAICSLPLPVAHTTWITPTQEN